jgi:signal transduction histidine kinase
LAAGLLFLVSAVIYLVIVNQTRRRQLESDQALIYRIISHEIRTPLTSIRLTLDRLRDLYDELPETGKDCLGSLLGSFRDLTQVINRRLTEFNSIPQLALIDAETAVSDIVSKRYRGLVSFAASERPCIIYASQFWFGICLQNLVNNALAYGISPVSIHVQQQGKVTIVAVQDAGTIKRSMLVKAAVPFKKSPDGHGLGIGLTIVKRKMREMGGKLEILTNPTRIQLMFRTHEDGSTPPIDH